MRHLTAMLVVVVSLIPNGATAQGALPKGATVYIEQIPLEGDIRAELTRQKVPLTVVASEADAQFVMINSESIDTTIGKVEGGLSLRVNRTGTLAVRETATNAIVWTEPWQVRSYNPKEERRVASRLVGKLKKAVGQSRK